MKFIFTLLSISILLACKEKTKPLSEDFNAICFVSSGNEIELGNGLFMHTPKIHYVSFIYHNTVFQVHIENKKSIYSYLKFGNKGKDSLLSLLKQYDKTSLNQQLKSITETNCNASCAPEGYFLSQNNEKLNFGIFHYNDYSYWLRKYHHTEIKLKPGQFPKIYQLIYHTFNSKQWDYLMSDDYRYKDIRTHGRIQFIEK